MTTIEEINRNAERALSYPPEIRIPMIEPLMAFFESVNELRDDQVLHLTTLKEYHATLSALARSEQQVNALRTGLEIIRGCESLECVRSLCDAALSLS